MWQHRHHAVRGQHRRDGDVGALLCVDVSVHDLAQGGVLERAEHGLLTALGKPLVHCLVGTLQGAVDPGRRRFECPRHPIPTPVSAG